MPRRSRKKSRRLSSRNSRRCRKSPRRSHRSRACARNARRVFRAVWIEDDDTQNGKWVDYVEKNGKRVRTTCTCGDVYATVDDNLSLEKISQSSLPKPKRVEGDLYDHAAKKGDWIFLQCGHAWHISCLMERVFPNECPQCGKPVTELDIYAMQGRRPPAGPMLAFHNQQESTRPSPRTQARVPSPLVKHIDPSPNVHILNDWTMSIIMLDRENITINFPALYTTSYVTFSMWGKHKFDPLAVVGENVRKYMQQYRNESKDVKLLEKEAILRVQLDKLHTQPGSFVLVFVDDVFAPNVFADGIPDYDNVKLLCIELRRLSDRTDCNAVKFSHELDHWCKSKRPGVLLSADFDGALDAVFSPCTVSAMLDQRHFQNGTGGPSLETWRQHSEDKQTRLRNIIATTCNITIYEQTRLWDIIYKIWSGSARLVLKERIENGTTTLDRLLARKGALFDRIREENEEHPITDASIPNAIQEVERLINNVDDLYAMIQL